MTVYAYDGPTPTRRNLQYVPNTSVSPSRLNSVIQTNTRPGEHWRLQLVWENLKQDDYHDLLGWLVRLNGSEHRAEFTFDSSLGYSGRGSRGGTPLVNGASQTGASIDVDGLPVSTSNWLRRGDLFSIAYVAANPDYRPLFMVTANVDTNGSGEATIPMRPALRFSPEDNEQILLSDSNVAGHFIMTSPVDFPLNARIADDDAPLSTITAEFIEDVRGS